MPDMGNGAPERLGKIRVVMISWAVTLTGYPTADIVY
jgi:hypothetical protein